MMEGRTKRQFYELKRSALALERATFGAHWKELADHVRPRRIRLNVTDRNKGDKRTRTIIDSTAADALSTLAAGMFTGMSSPARPWMKLIPENKALLESKPVKMWLEEVTDSMLQLFEESNIYTALPTFYADLGLFGTAAMGILPDVEETFRCYPYQIGTYYLGMNGQQRIDTFLREDQWTIKNLIETYGEENVSPNVLNQWKQDKQDTLVDICQIITPNVDYRPDSLYPQHKAFASCIYEVGAQADENKFLQESGFDYFPIVAARWEAGDGDIYGTDCPGMRGLPDIKQLYAQLKQKLKLLAKWVDPATIWPTSTRNQTPSLLPGSVTHFDETQNAKGPRPIHDVNLSGYEALVQDIEEIRRRIARVFYRDVFLIITSDDETGRTATEIMARREEKMLVMGPVLGQAKNEIYNPLVDIVFPIMDARGLIPPAPPELEGQGFRVNCISTVAQAQRSVAVAGVRQFLAEIAPYIEINPSLSLKVNWSKALDVIAEGLDVPEGVLFDEEEYQQMMAAQQQQVEAQRQSEMAMSLAKTGKDLGETPVDGGSTTALDKVMQGAR